MLKSPHPGVWWSPGAVARIRASNLDVQGLFAATACVEITDVASMAWGA